MLAQSDCLPWVAQVRQAVLKREDDGVITLSGCIYRINHPLFFIRRASGVVENMSKIHFSSALHQYKHTTLTTMFNRFNSAHICPLKVSH